MKKYEENMTKYEGIKKKYEKNMKKYEGITLPIYRPWDLEKFLARPARWSRIRVGGRGRREKRHETCQI